MDTGQRHARILELLQERGRVDVAELTGALDTSGVTVRRDLDHLAQNGSLRRVRGGAVPALRGAGVPFAARAAGGSAVKALLAQAARNLIVDGEAVAVDSGTTGAAAAVALNDHRGVVMPLSLQGIFALSESRSVELLLPAGSVRSGEGSIIGPGIEGMSLNLRFDTFVMTCCAADAAVGVTAFDLADAATKRAVKNASARTVLIAEGDKLTRSALAVVCPADAVDVLITDRTAGAASLQRWRDAGVEVEVLPAN